MKHSQHVQLGKTVVLSSSSLSAVTTSPSSYSSLSPPTSLPPLPEMIQSPVTDHKGDSPSTTLTLALTPGSSKALRRVTPPNPNILATPVTTSTSMTALDTLERENVYFVKLLKTSTAFNEEVFAIRTDDVDSLLQEFSESLFKSGLKPPALKLSGFEEVVVNRDAVKFRFLTYLPKRYPKKEKEVTTEVRSYRVNERTSRGFLVTKMLCNGEQLMKFPEPKMLSADWESILKEYKRGHHWIWDENGHVIRKLLRSPRKWHVRPSHASEWKSFGVAEQIRTAVENDNEVTFSDYGIKLRGVIFKGDPGPRKNSFYDNVTSVHCFLNSFVPFSIIYEGKKGTMEYILPLPVTFEIFGYKYDIVDFKVENKPTKVVKEHTVSAYAVEGREFIFRTEFLSSITSEPDPPLPSFIPLPLPDELSLEEKIGKIEKDDGFVLINGAGHYIYNQVLPKDAIKIEWIDFEAGLTDCVSKIAVGWRPLWMDEHQYSMRIWGMSYSGKKYEATVPEMFLCHSWRESYRRVCRYLSECSFSFICDKFDIPLWSAYAYSANIYWWKKND